MDSIEDLLSSKSKAKLGGQTSDDQTDDTQDDKKQSPEEKTPVAETSGDQALAEKMKQMKIMENENQVKAEAEGNNMPYIDLTEFPISQEALQLVPLNVSQDREIVSFISTGEQIRLGVTDPHNPHLEKITHTLEESHHAKVEAYLISQRSLKKALEIYDKIPKYKKPARGVEISEEELEKFKTIAKDFDALNEQVKKVNMTEMVSLIIAAALQAGSSDIHIEAEEKDVKVRLRVDGILHEAASMDKKIWPKVISRIKLLSGLKMNIDKQPQDGRFAINTAKEKIDVRVSTLPTTWGESVVMRLLKSSSIGLEFEQLGITGKAYEDLKTQVERPNGMIITTGPTGSGKTTTLYAILNKLNEEGTKIITLEDPVEYKLQGINQSQIDHSKGYSFADGLKSILRQDPDVVMVGELRDLETADVAINAALTGHMVISTIHTNSAAGAIPRFLAMGVKPFLLAPALNAIMGQRLCRRVCQECKQETELDEKTLTRVKDLLNAIPDDHPDKPKMENLKFYKGGGCEACNGIGYKGRVGIYEIMSMTPELEKIILSGKVSEYEMQDYAVKNGMLTMSQDGIIKALQGITSVEEVFRVSE